MFEEAKQGLWDKLRDQVIRLAEVAGYTSTALVRCEPLPLKDGPRNRFKSPLEDATGETIFEMYFST